MAKLKLQLFFMLLLGTTLAAPSQAEDVIDTAMSALSDPRAAAKHLREHRLLLNASFYDVGLGGCEKGGGITCASDLKALRLPKQRPSTSNAQRG